jgi:hypothetical protein
MKRHLRYDCVQSLNVNHIPSILMKRLRENIFFVETEIGNDFHIKKSQFLNR